MPRDIVRTAIQNKGQWVQVDVANRNVTKISHRYYIVSKHCRMRSGGLSKFQHGKSPLARAPSLQIHNYDENNGFNFLPQKACPVLVNG